jgi:hypothetical protein
MTTHKWQHMDDAPYDGTKIVGKYGDAECLVFWSEQRT